jgi:hypothetical protein
MIAVMDKFPWFFDEFIGWDPDSLEILKIIAIAYFNDSTSW